MQPGAQHVLFGAGESPEKINAALAAARDDLKELSFLLFKVFYLPCEKPLNVGRQIQARLFYHCGRAYFSSGAEYWMYVFPEKQLTKSC